MAYFETLKADYRHEYLTKQPTKSGAINNAAIIGRVRILDGSNNRALTIETDNGVFLQSYDTIVAFIDNNGNFNKLWDGYSTTTAKHIHTFRLLYNLPGICKKEWKKLETVTI